MSQGTGKVLMVFRDYLLPNPSPAFTSRQAAQLLSPSPISQGSRFASMGYQFLNTREVIRYCTVILCRIQYVASSTFFILWKNFFQDA